MRNRMMATNEGVGKKIVEALKKQTETEIELTQEYSESQNEDQTEVLDFSNENISEVEPSEIDTFYEATDNIVNIPGNSDSYEIQETLESVENTANEAVGNIEVQDTIQSMPKQPQGWDFGIKEEPQVTTFTQPQVSEPLSGAKQFDMPPNVAVLKRLITQLPSGVTKQTGAQIIKQTMEALGISMNTVLHEAQKVQDDMNESIKNCMTSIQEYKNNIKNLEKQGLDYQRQVNQLNDLISLFILSDKD